MRFHFNSNMVGFVLVDLMQSKQEVKLVSRSISIQCLRDKNMLMKRSTKKWYRLIQLVCLCD